MSAVEEMRRQIEAQRETIQNLRAAISDVSAVPSEWRLSRREAEIFVLLVRRELQTRATLFAAIYAAAGQDDVLESVIESHVSKLRAKLRPHGIEILARRNEGYRLVGRERFAHMARAVA